MKYSKKQIEKLTTIGVQNIELHRKKINGKYYTVITDDKNKIISKQKWKQSKTLKTVAQDLKVFFDKDFLKKKEEDEIIVYEIETQTSHNTKGTTTTKYNDKTFVNKYKTSFDFKCEGVFENLPTPAKIEKMVNGSLMGAWNSGKSDNKRFLKNSIYKELTNIDNVLRGYTVVERKIKKSQLSNVTNRFSAELQVTNNGKKWVGKNA